MKIVCISDTHKYEEDIELPEGDILVHSGDIDARTQTDLLKFNHWLGSTNFKYRIFIPGNHDFIFQNNFLFSKNLITNANVLCDSLVEIEGVKFWGSPWTPRFGGWAFMLSRGNSLKEKWDVIPENIDVLITHGPPQGVLDSTSRDYNIGCWDLMRAVEKIKPKYHIFGHIHPGFGKSEKIWEDGSKTIFINCAQLNDYYDLVNEPIVVEI